MKEFENQYLMQLWEEFCGFLLWITLVHTVSRYSVCVHHIFTLGLLIDARMRPYHNHLLQTTPLRNLYWFSNTLMSPVSSIDRGMNSELALAVTAATSGWATSGFITWRRTVGASWDFSYNRRSRPPGTGPSTARLLWTTSPTTISWQSEAFQATSTTMRLVHTTDTCSRHSTETTATVPSCTSEDSGTEVVTAEMPEWTLEITFSTGSC